MPATFKFYIRKDRANSQGECPIYLRITCNRKKKYHNTGEKIDPSDWDENKERVRRSHPLYKKLNDDLDILLHEAKEAARLLRRQKKESAKAIKERLVGASKKNFFTLAKFHLKQLQRNKQFYLHKQTKATLTKLEEFNGNKKLLFTEINSQYLTDFQQWMKEEKENKGSTIRKNMTDVRRIIKEAMDRHLIFNDPFEDVKPVSQGDPQKKVKLSLQQIKKLEELSLPEGSNEWHARNMFVLSFYLCGVRFGDMVTMKWEDVADGTLTYHMGKTKSGVNIPISDEAKSIIEQYRTEDDDGFIFPFLDKLTGRQLKDPNEVKQQISNENANINSYLKKVAKQAGIKKKISTHVARHSFAQHMANKGISIYELSGLLRHKSIKTTEQYLERINVSLATSTMKDAFK